MIPDAAVMLSAAKASPGRPTDWEVAFHEAGHVVAEVGVCGSVPDWAAISDDGSVDRAGETAARTFVGVSGPTIDVIDPSAGEMLNRARSRYAAVLLAGDLAETLALDLPIDPYESPAGCSTTRTGTKRPRTLPRFGR